jgi:hypothetical protein
MSKLPNINLSKECKISESEFTTLESPTIKHLSPKTQAFNVKYLCYAPPIHPHKANIKLPKFILNKNYNKN